MIVGFQVLFADDLLTQPHRQQPPQLALDGSDDSHSEDSEIKALPYTASQIAGDLGQHGHSRDASVTRDADDREERLQFLEARVRQLETLISRGAQSVIDKLHQHNEEKQAISEVKERLREDRRTINEEKQALREDKQGLREDQQALREEKQALRSEKQAFREEKDALKAEKQTWTTSKTLTEPAGDAASGPASTRPLVSREVQATATQVSLDLCALDFN